MKTMFSALLALLIFATPVWAQTISPTRDTASYWHDQYDTGTGIWFGEFPSYQELRLNYHRQNVTQSYFWYTADLVSALGWLPSDAIVVAGAGFGFLEGELEGTHGFTDVVSIEDGAWIQSAKDTTEDADMDAQIAAVGVNPLSQAGRDVKAQLTDGGTRARVTILDENLLTKESRNEVKKQFGGQIGIVFSDFMFPYLTDDEAIAFSAEANLTGAMVQHATCNGIDGRDLAAWVALIPGDTFVDICAGFAVAP